MEPEQAAQDLLIIGGQAAIGGVVRGHLYAVDAEVTLEPSAVVLGSILLNRGKLVLKGTPIVPQRIQLSGATLEGVPLVPGGTHTLDNGSVVELATTAPSTAAVALMRAVLPLPRPVPDADLGVRDLRSLQLKGFEEQRFLENAPELVVAGRARVKLQTAMVKGSLQRGWSGPEGAILLTGLQLENEAGAAQVYQSLTKKTEGGPKLSLKSALGGGQHAFFRTRHRFVLVWTQGPWLFALESKLAAPQASAMEELALIQRTLLALSPQISRSGS